MLSPDFLKTVDEKIPLKPRGKFIVLYGINNLGKTTQAKMLVEKIKSLGLACEHIKYPKYDLDPSGPMLNAYLRQGNPYNLNAREAQIIYCLNRLDYQLELIKMLEAGTNVIAEDYVGTGIAWGMANGVDKKFLQEINRRLLTPDLELLLDGERFRAGIEKYHSFENNDALTQRSRRAHLELRAEYGWPIINANQTIEEVHQAIWEKIKKITPDSGSQDIETALRAAYPPHSRVSEITVINPAGIAAAKATVENKTCSLKIKKLTAFAKSPARAHADDAGLDLYANDNYTLYEGERTAIGTGIAIAIPDGYAGLIWDKGGIAISGLHTMAGVVDAGYRGEIKVVVINLSGDIYHITRGQKIAQIIIQKIETPVLQESGVLDETARGMGGFGSSGKF